MSLSSAPEANPKVSSTGGKLLDRLGALASGLCAVHCLMVAFLPALLSTLGAGVLLSGRAEWVFTWVAALIALGAAYLGFRRHRSRAALTLFAFGIAGLFLSRFIEESGHHEEDAHAHEEYAHDEHAAAEHEADELHEEEHAGDEHAGHDHSGPEHLAGSIIGILSGLLLVGGHIVNLRATREAEEECC